MKAVLELRDQQIKELKEALRFYADIANYRALIRLDEGARARLALEKSGENVYSKPAKESYFKEYSKPHKENHAPQENPSI